jgi:hypothetical protein
MDYALKVKEDSKDIGKSIGPVYTRVNSLPVLTDQLHLLVDRLEGRIGNIMGRPSDPADVGENKPPVYSCNLEESLAETQNALERLACRIGEITGRIQL